MKTNTKVYRREYYLKNKEKAKEKLREWRKSNPIKNKENDLKWRATIGFKYSSYKSGAKNRDYEFLLSPEDFENIRNSNCHYCGGKSIGIDRVDNTQGYTLDNSVPCCTMCNKMKLNYTKESFIKKCKDVAKNYKD